MSWRENASAILDVASNGAKGLAGISKREISCGSNPFLIVNSFRGKARANAQIGLEAYHSNLLLPLEPSQRGWAHGEKLAGKVRREK